MPYKPKQLIKVYWTIGEVSEMFGIATSEIRFWETEFGHLHSSRRGRKINAHGEFFERRFTATDIQKVRTIYNLLNTEASLFQGLEKELWRLKKKFGETLDTYILCI